MLPLKSKTIPIDSGASSVAKLLIVSPVCCSPGSENSLSPAPSPAGSSGPSPSPAPAPYPHSPRIDEPRALVAFVAISPSGNTGRASFGTVGSGALMCGIVQRAVLRRAPPPSARPATPPPKPNPLHRATPHKAPCTLPRRLPSAPSPNFVPVRSTTPMQQTGATPPGKLPCSKAFSLGRASRPAWLHPPHLLPDLLAPTD